MGLLDVRILDRRLEDSKKSDSLICARIDRTPLIPLFLQIGESFILVNKCASTVISTLSRIKDDYEVRYSCKNE